MHSPPSDERDRGKKKEERGPISNLMDFLADGEDVGGEEGEEEAGDEGGEEGDGDEGLDSAVRGMSLSGEGSSSKKRKSLGPTKKVGKKRRVG
jgi:hypothetical protein